MSRRQVLIKSNRETADELVSRPNQWLLIGTDDDPTRFATFNQTAYRIRQGGLVDFVREGGRFDAKATCASNRPHPMAPIELSARWVPDPSPPGAG